MSSRAIKCYACNASDSKPFYIGNVCYNLCEACIKSIAKASDTAALMIAYQNLDLEQYERDMQFEESVLWIAERYFNHK